MGIRPLQLDVTEGSANNTTVPTLGKVEEMIATVDSWDEVMHLGNTFTIADTENISATITQNDTTNNPAALIIANTGSGNDITLPNSSYIKNGLLILGGDIGTTVARISKGWFTALELTDWPSKAGTGITNQYLATTDTPSFAAMTIAADVDGYLLITPAATTVTVEVGDHITDVHVNQDTRDVNFNIWGTGATDPVFFTDAGNNNAGINTNTPDANFALDVTGNLKTSGDFGSTSVRVSKGWFTNLEVTNYPFVNGTPLSNQYLATTNTVSFAQVTVDNLVLNGNTLSSTSGNINITPDNAADDIIINGHWSFDGKTLVAISDSDTTLTAYAGKNIAIEGVTFDGGIVAGITDLTVDGNLTIAKDAGGWLEITPAATGIQIHGGTDITFVAFNAVNNYDTNFEVYGTGSMVFKVDAGTDTASVGGSSTTEKFNVLGNIYLSGYINQAGIFAEIYVADASTAQSIATGAGYTKSTAFTNNGQSANCTSDATNDKITITQTGKYRVSGSCSATSGKANLTWRGAAFLNNVEQSQVHWKRKMTTTTDSGDMGFTGLIDVTSVPWDLDFRLRHDDGGNQNFTIEYANLNVEYMGAT